MNKQKMVFSTFLTMIGKIPDDGSVDMVPEMALHRLIDIAVDAVEYIQHKCAIEVDAPLRIRQEFRDANPAQPIDPRMVATADIPALATVVLQNKLDFARKCLLACVDENVLPAALHAMVLKAYEDTKP